MSLPEPSKSPSLTLNSARTPKQSAPPSTTATTKKRRNKDKVEDKKKNEHPDEGILFLLSINIIIVINGILVEKVEIEKGTGVFIFPNGIRYGMR